MLHRSETGPGESKVLEAVSFCRRYPVSHFWRSGENTWCVSASLFPKVAVPPVVITAMNGENSLWSTLIAAVRATPGCLGASSRKTTPPLLGAFPVVETRTTPTMRGKDSGGSDEAAPGDCVLEAGTDGARAALQPEPTATRPSRVRSACRPGMGIIAGVLGA